MDIKMSTIIQTSYGLSCPEQSGSRAPLAASADEPRSIEDLKASAMSEFNKHRLIIIRSISPASTYNDVKAFVCPYMVSNIAISKKLRHAIVELKNGWEAESAVLALSNKKLLGESVKVSLHRNDNLLCITNLPLTTDDHGLRGIVEPLGPVDKCFLMRDTKGLSKGYAFVEFAHNREQSEEARSLLEARYVDDFTTLRCEFVKESLVTFESLHSICLFINHLPMEYKDCEGLKNVFSVVAPPVYCRLTTVDGSSLSFGLVQFRSRIIAERTFSLRQGHLIHGQAIRIAYCAPGMNASEMYNKIMMDVDILHSSKQAPRRLSIETGRNPCRVSIGERKNVSRNLPAGAALRPTVLAAGAEQFPRPLSVRNTTVELGGQSAAGSLPTTTNRPIITRAPPVINPMVREFLQQNVDGFSVLNNFEQLLGQLGQQHAASSTPTGNTDQLLNPYLQISLLSAMLAAQLEKVQPTISNATEVAAMSAACGPMLTQANQLLLNLSSNGQPISGASDQLPLLGQQTLNSLASFSSRPPSLVVRCESPGPHIPGQHQITSHHQDHVHHQSTGHHPIMSHNQTSGHNQITGHHPTEGYRHILVHPATLHIGPNLIDNAPQSYHIPPHSQLASTHLYQPLNQGNSLSTNSSNDLKRRFNDDKRDPPGLQRQPGMMREESSNKDSSLDYPPQKTSRSTLTDNSSNYEASVNPSHDSQNVYNAGQLSLPTSTVVDNSSEDILGVVPIDLRHIFDLVKNTQSIVATATDSKDLGATKETIHAGKGYNFNSSQKPTGFAFDGAKLSVVPTLGSPVVARAIERKILSSMIDLRPIALANDSFSGGKKTEGNENVGTPRPFITCRRGRTTSTVRDTSLVIESLTRPVIASPGGEGDTRRELVEGRRGAYNAERLRRADRIIQERNRRVVGSSLDQLPTTSSKEARGDCPVVPFVDPSVSGGSVGIIGRKRVYQNVPSLEDSSNCPYIGQHSQGLGGDYADTYLKRCKLD